MDGILDTCIWNRVCYIYLGSPKLLWGRLLFSHFFLLLLLGLLFFQIDFIELKKIRLVQEEKVYQITEK